MHVHPVDSYDVDKVRTIDSPNPKFTLICQKVSIFFLSHDIMLCCLRQCPAAQRSYKLGPYSVIISFSSSLSNYYDAGGRVLPLCHYFIILTH